MSLQTVTSHDIEANGKTYILEWTHSEDGEGYIAITETCNAGKDCKIDREGYCPTHDAWSDDGEECDAADICDSHETYDFKEFIG